MEKGRLCIKCMKEIQEFDICPYCGFSQSSSLISNCLPPRTLLQERYFIGTVMKKTGEGITYMGFDNVADASVVIREFFPANIAGRDSIDFKIHPLSGSESRYKTLLLDFIDLAKIMTRSRSLSAIIPVLDVFEENNTVYTVSQYIESITLQEYLMQVGGEISWEQAKAQFAPVISAINTIHGSVNLNHLGISPETILVDKNENFKISDFSIEALRITKTDIIPEIYEGYAAPEQYNSANWIGEWSDVYGIAAVIYKSVTGTMPPESTGRIVNDNLMPAYKLNKNVPVNISNALMRAMNVSPEKRTQSVDELIIAFSETAEFLNPEVPASPKPKAGKSRWIWACVIAGSIIVIGFVIFFVAQWLFKDNGPPLFPDNSGASAEQITSQIRNDEKTSMPAREKITIEDFVGKKLEDIKSKYSNIDFKIPDENFVFNESYPKGVIIEQSIKKDEKVEPGTTIVLKVSKGSATFEVPNYIGKTLKFVEADLAKVGIKYKIEEVQTNDAQTGTVVSTNPTQGFLLKADSQELVIMVAVKAQQTTTSSSSERPSKQPETSKAPTSTTPDFPTD